MGLADWDLLSLIPGFAQATSLTANQYPNGKGFDCPNQSLGAEAAMMSDEMLKSVGHALCSKDELVAAALRGTDDVNGNRTWTTGGRKVTRQAVPHLTLRPDMNVYEPVQRRFAVASIEPVRVDTARDLIDDIHLRARRTDAIDPCAGAIAGKSAAGCDGEHPRGGGDHHSGDDHHSGGDTDHGDTGHVDLGEHNNSGDGRDGEDYDHSGDGEYSHGGDGDSSHDGEDSGSSHDGSGDYADNEDSHGGGDGGSSSHDGGSDGRDSLQDDRSGSSDGESHSGGDYGGGRGDGGYNEDSSGHGGGGGEDGHSGGGWGGGGSSHGGHG